MNTTPENQKRNSAILKLAAHASYGVVAHRLGLSRNLVAGVINRAKRNKTFAPPKNGPTERIAQSFAKVRGEANGAAKLTDEIVRFIRGSRISGRQPGKRYGVNPSVVNRVRRGEAWKGDYPALDRKGMLPYGNTPTGRRWRRPRWVIAGMLLLQGVAYGSLGPTTIRTEPSGTVGLPLIMQRSGLNASVRLANGCVHSESGSSVWSTIFMPLTPSTLGSGCGNSIMSHSAPPPRNLDISPASLDASGSVPTYTTLYFNFGFPANALLTFSYSTRRVAALACSCSNASFACAVSFCASANWTTNAAIRSLAATIFSSDCCLSSSQRRSFTFPNLTIANVERTPNIRLASSTKLATSNQNVADARDISENGHIRFPDWFFLGGIAVVVISGLAAIWFQILSIIRRRR